MRFTALALMALLALAPLQVAYADLGDSLRGILSRTVERGAETVVGSAIDRATDSIQGRVSKDVQGLIDKGEQLGCGQATGEHGGSLATTMEGLMRDLIQDVKGSLVGAAQGQVRDFLGRISANAGPLAPIVQPLINFIGRKADTLIRQAGEKLFAPITAAFEKEATAAVSNVAQSLGLNVAGFSGIAGISAVLPGLPGGVGSVPVNETGAQLSSIQNTEKLTVNIRELSQYIKEAQGTQLYVACVANPAIAKAKNAVLAQQAREMIKTAAEKQITNIAVAAERGAEFYARKQIDASAQGMCSAHQQKLIEILDDMVSGKSWAQCNEAFTQKPGADFNFDTQVASVMNPGNQPAIQVLEGYATAHQSARTAVGLTLLEYHKNEGFDSTVECDENRARVPGELCIEGKVMLHGKVFANALSDTINTPTRQLVQADEIGELIDAMSAGLKQVAFQNIRGLTGLVERSGSRGSYVDDMVNQNYDESSVSPQRVLTGDITAALAVETQYGQALDIILADLTAGKKNYEEIAACYEPLRAQGKGDITPQIARDSVDLATTTLAVITPQLTILLTQKANSNSALDELVELVNAAETALSPRDVVDISARFSELKASGRMHNMTDLQALITSMQFGAEALERMLRDATVLLTACKTAI